MIIDLPTKEDFKKLGIDYLYLAWSDITSLLGDLSLEVEYGAHDIDENFERTFWRQSQRRLRVAASLVALGAEQLLKSKISSVSVYALLPTPDKWPGEAQIKNRPFADFYAPDAQLLPKIHDTICTTRLDSKFRTRLDDIRNRRNRIQHTIDVSIR